MKFNKNTLGVTMKVLSCLHWRDGSLNRLILSDHVLRLGRKRSTRLPCIEGCSGGKDALFEEALANKFFQVHPEVSTVDGLVRFTVMVRNNIFSLWEIWSCIGLALGA